jgi:hypothetical protein
MKQIERRARLSAEIDWAACCVIITGKPPDCVLISFILFYRVGEECKHDHSDCIPNMRPSGFAGNSSTLRRGHFDFQRGADEIMRKAEFFYYTGVLDKSEFSESPRPVPIGKIAEPLTGFPSAYRFSLLVS